MASLTATTDPATGTIRVDVEQTTMRDLFTRVVANSWGNATTGQAWTSTGGVAANFSVNGTQGLHAVTTVNASRRSVLDTGFPDMGGQFQVTIPVTATTNPIDSGLYLRHIDVSNNYYINISIAPSNTVTLSIRRNVLGVETTLTSVVLAQTHAAGATWFVKGEICGSTVRGKAWRSTVTEPGWVSTTTDSAVTTGNEIGARSFVGTGNPAITFTYDNAFSYVSQPIRLYRVTPDGVRTEVRGSPGNTEDATAAAASATATYWDGEAPFDVDVYYEMTSACSATTVLTSNTVNLDSGGDGWLRDPTDPGLNLRIVMDDFFDECVDEDVIVFSGLDTREYENASGVFDRVNTARPNTVSMKRKNNGSTLYLTSFSLDDIDTLEDIFANGRVLLLTLPTVYGWAHRSFGTDYITCFDITQSLLGVDQRVSTRVWTIPYRLSTEPVDTSEGGTGGNGIGGGGATYDILAASVIGTTYNSLTAAGFTYTQIAQGVGY